jgi:hypothetical protein
MPRLPFDKLRMSGGQALRQAQGERFWAAMPIAARGEPVEPRAEMLGTGTGRMVCRTLGSNHTIWRVGVKRRGATTMASVTLDGDGGVSWVLKAGWEVGLRMLVAA